MRSGLLLAFVAAMSAAACSSPAANTIRPELAPAFERGDPLAISDALESLIAEGRDTQADREAAYERVLVHEEDTVEYAFARAALAGRVVQAKGLTATSLVGEVERYAERCLAKDPGFRGGAAKRMLGTLYVLAPGPLLAHGDSEKGLEILEGLVKEAPEVPENQLRLAEAFVALGDAAPAIEPLCRALAMKAKLRKDEQALADKLYEDAGRPACSP